MQLNSASNRQCTLLRKLNRKKYRQKEQFFLLEGARAVQQVLENKSVGIKTLFFDESQQYWEQASWSAYTKKVESATLPENLFAEVTDTDTPQGVLALCHMPEETDLEQLISRQGVVVALDAVQDPGNLGTIIRTASWFGAKGLLSGKGTVDLFHPKVVRSTAGATGIIPHINGNLSELLARFSEQGWSVYLLDAGAEAESLRDIHPPEKCLIVVGNEAHGIDPELYAPGYTKVQIPASSPQVESLNAGVATSIALYDLVGKQE